MSRLLGWMANKVGSLFSKGAPTPPRDPRQQAYEDAIRERERVKAGPSGIANNLRIAPFNDENTGELASHRRDYRKWAMKDPTVKQALLSKVFGVAVLDHSVQPASDSPVDKQASEFIDHCVKRLEDGILGAACSILLPGMIDGYSIAEKVWTIEDREGEWKNKIIGKSLKSKHPDTYQLMVDEFNNVSSIRGLMYNSGQEFSTKEFILWQHLPLYSDPHGSSDVRSANRAAWMIDTTWKLCMHKLEKFSTPYFVATYKDGTILGQLETQLQQARGSGYIMVQDGTLIDPKDLAGAGIDAFITVILNLQHEIMLGITGAFLQAMEGVKTGARSIGEIHASTAELLVWFLKQSLCSCLNEQWVPDLIKFNFPPGTGFPRIELGGINEAELELSTKIDEALQRMGLDLSMSEIYERYNRSKPADPADTLTPPLPAAGPMFAEPDTEPEPAPKYQEAALAMLRERLGITAGTPANGNGHSNGNGDAKPFNDVLAKVNRIEGMLARPPEKPLPPQPPPTIIVNVPEVKPERKPNVRIKHDEHGRIEGIEYGAIEIEHGDNPAGQDQGIPRAGTTHGTDPAPVP